MSALDGHVHDCEAANRALMEEIEHQAKENEEIVVQLQRKSRVQEMRDR